MSAYIVDKPVIDALVALAQWGPKDRAPAYPGDGWSGPYTYRDRSEQDIGAALVAENILSIQARYPDTIADPEHMPGPIVHYWEPTYTFDPTVKRPTAVEGLAVIAHYEYQSCEHPEWMTSDAHEFCDGLRHSLIRELPGLPRGAVGLARMTMRELRAACRRSEAAAMARAIGRTDERLRLAVAQREAAAYSRGIACSECRRPADRRTLDDSGRCGDCTP